MVEWMGKEPIYRCNQPGHNRPGLAYARPFHCGVHQAWNWTPTCCDKAASESWRRENYGDQLPVWRCQTCKMVIDHDQNHVGVACDVPGCLRYETPTRVLATSDSHDGSVWTVTTAGHDSASYRGRRDRAEYVPSYDRCTKPGVIAMLGMVPGVTNVWLFTSDETQFVRTGQIAIVIAGDYRDSDIDGMMAECLAAGTVTQGNRGEDPFWYDLSGLKKELRKWVGKFGSEQMLGATRVTQAVFRQHWMEFEAQALWEADMLRRSGESKSQPDKEWYTKTSPSRVFGNASIFVPPRHAKTETVRGLCEMRDQIEAAENDLRLNYGQGAVDEAKKIALTSGRTYADALARMIIKYGAAQQLSAFLPSSVADCYASLEAEVRSRGLASYTPSQTVSQIPKETPVEFGPYEIKFEHTEKSREEMARLSKELREAASKSPQRIEVRKDHPKPPKNNFVSWNLTADVRIKDIHGTMNVKGPAQIMIGMASIDALDMKYGELTLRQLLEIDEAARQDRNVKDPSAPGGWVKAVVLRKAFTQHQRDAVSAYLSAQLKVKVQASEAERKAKETSVVVGDDEMWLSNCKDVE